MIKGPDSQTELFLNDLALISRRIEKAQREIGSGKRINSISDAPDQIGQLLSLRSELGSLEQTRRNLGRVKTEVDTAEAAIANAITLLERVEVLGTQGRSDLTSANTRTVLAEEVETILVRLVDLSATNLEGRYLFSGDSDQVPPYTLDLTQPQPVSTYQGTIGTRQVPHPSGPRFTIARTAEQIFDDPDPSRNVFNSVRELRDALRANDGTAIGAALSNIRSATTHVNSHLAWYGGVQNRVAESLDFAARHEVRIRTRISEVEDADVAQAIVELNQLRFQQEAALATQGARTRRNLFDYLA